MTLVAPSLITEKREEMYKLQRTEQNNQPTNPILNPSLLLAEVS
ncbi:hypothetical protein PP707_03510 [Acetobacter pasteurianus]|nr:hypothetical protein [Acetobacter pasteurianus]